MAKRPYDALTGALPLVLTAPQRRRALTLVEKRIATRKPLAGGRDGLAFVRRVLADAGRHLSPHGVLVVENGNNRKVLERAYPMLPLTRVETSAGGDIVFLLTRGTLGKAQLDPMQSA